MPRMNQTGPDLNALQGKDVGVASIFDVRSSTTWVKLVITILSFFFNLQFCSVSSFPLTHF